jgi:RraA family protein
MALGFRILRRRQCVDFALVERFRVVPVANVSDSMSRMAAAGPRLRPMQAGGGMAGPALTVKLRPGDNLMLHKALDLAEPGDVIVADAGGDLTTAIMGDLMLNYAIQRGVAGIVVNGAVRDVDSIRALDLPVYAAGVTHRGPYKDGPGEINVPVALDGMVVEPGDLVLGDADGVLAVARLAAPEILALAEAKQASEAREMAAFRNGTSDRSWVDRVLRERGCIVEE